MKTKIKGAVFAAYFVTILAVSVFTVTTSAQGGSKRQPSGKPNKVISPQVFAPVVGPVPDLVTVGTYPFTSASGVALEDMSSGTTQLVAAGLDDTASGLTNIGFDFWYDGVRATQFSVNANGLARLGPTVIDTASNNSLASTTDAPKIAPYWDNLWVGTNGKVHFKVVGSAPSRKLIVEWQNMTIPRQTAATTGAGTFQLWLFETSGVIEFVYGNAIVLNSGGYSVGLQSGAATNFASVSTSGPTISYATANNAQTSAITAGTAYLFTPNVPAAPSGLTFAPVTPTNIQLNWTDNATNEVGYAIYRSLDGVNYTFLTQLAANTATFNNTDLDPGTIYSYNVYAVTEGAVSTALSGSQTTPVGGAISSTVTGGNWSDPATWTGGVVPTSADNVTIVTGATVTINSSDALSVTVQGGGTLQFEDTVARTLTVGQSVTINSGGTFQSNPTGTQTGHVLSVNRNLTNNGTLNFSTNANTAGANVTFTGAGNNAFGGTGATTNIRTMTINKGTSNANILELNPTNFTVQGVTTDVAGYLILTNGTLKISGTSAVANRTFTTAAYIIPVTAGIWLDNPNYTVAATASSTTTFNNGLLRISQGNYNVGIGAGDLMKGGAGSVFILEGGTINVSGSFSSATSGTAFTYTQTNGTMNVGTVGNTASNIGTFEINFNSPVTISGGTINIINPSTGLPKVDFRNDTASTSTITGGNVVFGGPGAPANGIYNVTAAQLPNVTVNPTQTLTTFSQPSSMRGSTVTNNGVISGTATFNFASTNGAMTYGGSGVFGTVAAPYTGNIAANSAFSTTLNAPITCLSILLFQGGFINSNQITLGNGGTSATNIQVGGIGTTPAGTFDVSPVHNQGTGGQTVNYATQSLPYTTGVEINPTRIVATLQAGNPNNVTIAGGNVFVSGTLILGSGKLNTSAANLITVNGTATNNVSGGSATAYVNGPLAITLPASLVSGSTYNLPIGKGTFNMLELVNPTTNAGGTVVVQAEVFDVDSGGTPGTGLDGINHNRYWQAAISSGAPNFTNTTVRLTEIPLSNVRIGQSATQAGAYNFIGGTVVGNTVQSNTITSLDYFVLGFANLAGGTYNVGSAAIYPTLTAAVADLNSRVATGPVTLSLTDATYPGETFPITIAASAAFSSTNTVTIKPAPGVSPSLSGSSASSMINLNGADWVTIDGSNAIGGTSRDLTITNTNAASTNTVVIQLTSLGVGAGATNNTVKNTNLVGSTVTATAATLAGVFSGGTAAINISNRGANNNNNTIQNNAITKTTYGIYTSGASAANKTVGTFIAQNVMDAASPNNITTGGILAFFEDGIQIAQNNIGVLKHNGATGTSGTAFGIALGAVPNASFTFFSGNDVTNASVTANRINGITSLNPSSTLTCGIVVNTVTSGTTRVFNNMVSGITSISTPSNFTAGIIAGGGTGSAAQIYANSVSMTGSRGASTSPSYGLAIHSGDPVVDVRDNIFYNTQTSTSTGKMYAIGAASTTFANMTSNFNDLFASGASAFVGQTGGLGTAGTDRLDLAAWQAATGRDTPNSISADPTFTSTSDLHLLTGSPAVNAGITIAGIPNDFDGDLRDATPDIGADEIAGGATPTPTPATPTPTPATPTPTPATPTPTPATPTPTPATPTPTPATPTPTPATPTPTPATPTPTPATPTPTPATPTPTPATPTPTPATPTPTPATPTPTPATPTPTPATPTPTPATPTPTPTPATPTPTPATPTPTPATPTPTPATPTPTPATPTPPPATPTPTATPTVTPTTPTPTPTVTPPTTPTPTASPSATPLLTQAINLSTRMRVQTGDRVGIGGLIITGSAPKQVLLRAIGPSLTHFGVPNVLADPVMELHGSGAFATIINNNWRDTQEDAIQATGIPPTDDLESAILVTLNPGAYTAIVKGQNNTSGVGLIEVYDLNQGAASKLANLSTRAFISTGSDIVIAGFLLSDGNDSSRVVLRGIGPSLAPGLFPAAAVLADPTLELRDANGALLIANNDWQDNAVQAALLTAAGLAPTNNLEAGIYAALPPGLYTALLAGLNNGTGIGLVEVYDLGP